MSAAGYMTTPEWATLADATVLGRPVKVWQRRPRSVGELMALSVGEDNHDFLVQGDRRFTYAAFRTAVEAGAAALAERGIGRGDRVMIVLYNSPELWLAQCALWRLGAVPVLGNRWWSRPALDEAAARIVPALIVTDIIPGDAAIAHITPGDIAAWWRLPTPAVPAPDPAAAIDEDELAVIVFTAGSTGAPKGVQLSHRVLVWTQQTIQAMRGGQPAVAPATPAAQKVALTTTPLFHNGGMVATLGTQLDGGRIVFLKGRFEPGEALRLIERERVTSWSAVPTMFGRLLHHADVATRDLSSLVAPASGGAAVTDDFVRDVATRLPAAARGFSSGYGMTEMSFLTMVAAADLLQRPGTVGRLVPGVEMRVAAPDVHGEGELEARSAGLMLGYFDGLDDPIDQAGWYRTGDVGRIDADGFVYLTGRCKDMIIRGGENISCQHVEAALLSHPDVAEAAVIGRPDPEFGEAVVAVVHPRAGATLDFTMLADHARAHLAYFEVPTRWIVRDAPLPVLPTGKIDKQELSRAVAGAA